MTKYGFQPDGQFTEYERRMCRERILDWLENHDGEATRGVLFRNALGSNFSAALVNVVFRDLINEELITIERDTRTGGGPRWIVRLRVLH